MTKHVCLGKIVVELLAITVGVLGRACLWYSEGTLGTRNWTLVLGQWPVI